MNGAKSAFSFIWIDECESAIVLLVGWLYVSCTVYKKPAEWLMLYYIWK